MKLIRLEKWTRVKYKPLIVKLDNKYIVIRWLKYELVFKLT